MEQYGNISKNACLAFLIFLTLISIVSSIDCFKCVSMNGQFSPCDDPFHNNHSLHLLESPCMGGRKGRDGLFPATSCIKLAGVFGPLSAATGLPPVLFNMDNWLQVDTVTGVSGHTARYKGDNKETITVRGCGLDSGTVTTDTEIVRMSHCGRFYYNDRYVHGCLQSCSDADACNKANRMSTEKWMPAILIITYHILSHFIS